MLLLILPGEVFLPDLLLQQNEKYTTAESSTKPRVVVSASAAGIYGNGGDKLLTETSSPGTDFLAQVCMDWEKEIQEGCDKPQVRCVLIRTGIVLGNGGMVKTLKPIFSLGLGGKLSTGNQYMPWISLADIVRLYAFALTRESLSGPVNAVAPEQITNAEFTRQLAAVLHRPAIFSVPKVALQMLYGEFGELMLYGQKVSNQKLIQAGFTFTHERLRQCLLEVV